MGSELSGTSHVCPIIRIACMQSRREFAGVKFKTSLAFTDSLFSLIFCDKMSLLAKLSCFVGTLYLCYLSWKILKFLVELIKTTFGRSVDFKRFGDWAGIWLILICVPFLNGLK